MSKFEKFLNATQFEAVMATEGPVLVLAGAGTGKTRVITYRIAHLIEELGVAPSNILAVTFTNKAAGEMKSRLVSLVGANAYNVNMGTFHSICLNILRQSGYKIGLASSFSVLDQEDRLNFVRQAMRIIDLDVKKYPPKQYMHAISSFKNTDAFIEDREPQDVFKKFKEVYRIYSTLLKEQRMIDFDDMLGLAVKLFLLDGETLAEYREIYKYILVDEYQDTNAVQFRLLYLLSGIDGNLCVVGDDDQSVYGWRGAEIRNILEFDGIFEKVREIKLVDNYRSGSSILDTANKLIANNRARRGKSLTAFRNVTGAVTQAPLQDEVHEADFVSGIIKEAALAGSDLSEIAVLYRTNAQSRNFEVAFSRAGIPYKVIGGTGFYQRREIKDILSYLRFYDNVFDEVSFRRSIKNPSRSIGDASIDKISAYASDKNLDLLTALKECFSTFSANRRPALENYIETIEGLREAKSIRDKIDHVVKKTNYEEYLKQFEEPDEASRRLDNVMELYSAATAFEESAPLATLTDFLANTALVTVDDEKSANGVVKLMTMHAAKGLEFTTVFLTGLEEGLFPLASAEGEGNLEEERRLCYVGFTRAKDKLYLTRVNNRLQYGRRQLSVPSRFLREAGILGGGYPAQPSNNIKKDVFSGGMVYNKNDNGQPRGANGAAFPVSTKVSHSVFGDGIVIGSEGVGAGEKVTVQFRKSGIKKILAGFLTRRD